MLAGPGSGGGRWGHLWCPEPRHSQGGMWAHAEELGTRRRTGPLPRNMAQFSEAAYSASKRNGDKRGCRGLRVSQFEVKHHSHTVLQDTPHMPSPTCVRVALSLEKKGNQEGSCPFSKDAGWQKLNQTEARQFPKDICDTSFDSNLPVPLKLQEDYKGG